MVEAGGKAIHPVFGLPGGVSKPISPELPRQVRRGRPRTRSSSASSRCRSSEDVVLSNSEYVDLITSDAYTHKTYYMGLVDQANKVNFYDGRLRVVDPDGKEYLKFAANEYLDHVAEHVEPWTYMKFCYLKDVGWKGFDDGADSGVYAVAPLARLNAADGMATPPPRRPTRSSSQYLGGKPVHFTLATHWARLVELLYAAERMGELANDSGDHEPQRPHDPDSDADEGIGVVEAPRGTLIHHYETDEHGLITQANLIVATQNNAARIAMSVDKAAKALIHGRHVDEGLLNLVEMAFRAYDPCFGCATHACRARCRSSSRSGTCRASSSGRSAGTDAGRAGTE